MADKNQLAKLHAEIAELEAKRAKLMAEIGDVDPVEGESYYLLKGYATVTGFYAEDGIDKVRMDIIPFSPSDGLTLRGEAQKWSIPLSDFQYQLQEYKILKRMIDLKNNGRG